VGAETNEPDISCGTYSLVAEGGVSLDQPGVDGSLASWLGMSQQVVIAKVQDVEVTARELGERETDGVSLRTDVSVVDGRVVWGNPWSDRVQAVERVTYGGPRGDVDVVDEEPRPVCQGDKVVMFVAGPSERLPDAAQAFAVVPLRNGVIEASQDLETRSIPAALDGVSGDGLEGLLREHERLVPDLLRDVVELPLGARMQEILRRQSEGAAEDPA
jgi:hypothetical protein